MAATTIAELQVQITAQNKQFQQAIRELISQLDGAGDSSTRMSKKSAVAFGAIAGAAQAAVSKGINIISSSLDGAIRRVDTLDNAPKVLQNLGYTADESARSIRKIADGLVGLPSRLDDVVTNQLAIASATGYSLDRVTDLTLAFNNMALAGGKGAQEAQRAFVQFTQALGRGKFQAQDFNTLMEVMPAQLAQVAQSLLGPAANAIELREALSDGKVTNEQFVDSVIELDKKGGKGFASFEKQARDATKGIRTSLDNMVARTMIGMQEIIKAVGSDDISKAINGIGNGFRDALKEIAKFIPAIKEVGREVFNYMYPAIRSLYGAVADNLVPALARLLDKLQPLISLVGGVAVGALFAFVAATAAVVDIVSGLINVLTANETVFRVLTATVAGVAAGILAYRAAVVVASAATAVHSAALYLLGTRAVVVNGQIMLVRNAVSLATIAQNLWNAAMMANPIGRVIGAVVGLTAVIAILTGATNRQSAEERALNDQRDRSIRLANELKRSEDELKGAKDNVKDASLRQERAQRTYNEAVVQYGKDSLEAREAARQLERANEDLKNANNRVKGAVEGNTKAIQAQKAEMDELSRRLQSFNGKTFTYYIQGVEHAVQRGSDGRTYVTPTFSSGGFTGRGGKYEPAGIVHKGEYVVPKHLVNQATGLPDFSKMKLPSFAAGGLVGGTPSVRGIEGSKRPIVLQLPDGTPLANFIIDEINDRAFLTNNSVITV